MSLRSMSIRF